MSDESSKTSAPAPDSLQWKPLPTTTEEVFDWYFDLHKKRNDKIAYTREDA